MIKMEAETPLVQDKPEEPETTGETLPPDKVTQTIQHDIDTQKIQQGLSEETTKQLIELLKTQNANISELKKELDIAKSQLKDVKDEIEAEKPFILRAEVKGTFNYAEIEKTFMTDEVKTDREYAREIYNRILREYPTI